MPLVTERLILRALSMLAGSFDLYELARHSQNILVDLLNVAVSVEDIHAVLAGEEHVVAVIDRTMELNTPRLDSVAELLRSKTLLASFGRRIEIEHSVPTTGLHVVFDLANQSHLSRIGPLHRQDRQEEPIDDQHVVVILLCGELVEKRLPCRAEDQNLYSIAERVLEEHSPQKAARLSIEHMTVTTANAILIECLIQQLCLRRLSAPVDALENDPGRLAHWPKLSGGFTWSPRQIDWAPDDDVSSPYDDFRTGAVQHRMFEPLW